MIIKGDIMKKFAILLVCCAFAAPAMNDKNHLLKELKEHMKALDRDAVAFTLLSGGVVVSRIFAQACDGQDYCFVARTVPLLPGMTMVAINLVRQLYNN